MSDTLTLSHLRDLHDKFKMAQPFSDPIVGTIMNDGAWKTIKEEIEMNSPNRLYDHTRSDVDYLWGSAVYGSPNIDQDKTEVYFDTELLEKRLKEL